MIKRILLRILDKRKHLKEKAMLREYNMRRYYKKTYDDYRLQQIISVYRYRLK